MSRDIVTAVQAPFLNAFALLERSIDVCPEEIWREKNGGWPVWQQIYHALTALDFFVGQVGTPSDWPFDQATGSLNVVSEQYLTKEAAKKLATEAKARVDIYLAGLSDADLAVREPRLSAVFGSDVPHGAIVGMLASHTLYHVGSCDAALRDHGLKGVF